MDVVNEFHRLWYQNLGWKKQAIGGVQILQCPLDMMAYAKIIDECRPDIIIQTGVYKGGSLLWFWMCLREAGNEDWSRIIGVDVDEPTENIARDYTIFVGDSTSPMILSLIRATIANMSLNRQQRVMVSLDSDHSKAHVQKEIELYAPLVTAGSYFVVEDCNAAVAGWGDGKPTANDAVNEWDHDGAGFDEVTKDIVADNLFTFHRWFRKR
jgi:cephalosporin hydroxylase